MLSEKFWADAKSQTPSEYIETTATLFEQMFPPEHRTEARERLNTALDPLVPTEETGIQLLQVDEFAEAVGDPPPAIAKGFLSQKDLILIAAKPKMCKSFLALQILDDIARGRKILGKWEIEKQGTVVYLGMEDNPQEIKRRLDARGMIGYGLPFYAINGRMNLGSKEGIKNLKGMLDKLPEPPITICIDTARVALGVEDWNNPADVTKKILHVLELARERCLILLIAHNRKADGDGGDKISGSNAMQSNVDGYLIVNEKRVLGNGNVILDLEMETRSAPAQKFSVEMDTETNHMRALNDEEQKQASADKKSAERKTWYGKIAKLFESGNELSVTSIAEQLSINYRFAYDLVNEMSEMDDLKKTGRTRTSEKGRPSPLYTLTERGINYFLPARDIGNSPEEINQSPSVTVQPLSKNGQRPPPDSPVAAFFNAPDAEPEEWEQ